MPAASRTALSELLASDVLQTRASGKRPDGKPNMPRGSKLSLRILNLEDDEGDAALNKAMLSARWPDCVISRVDTRADFVAALEGGQTDLILSDYSIPGFGGEEALILARERWPQIPFLFVSGAIGEDAAIEFIKSGATDYVLKHRLMRLIPAVDRALRELDRAAERAHADYALRESEHMYRQVFECLGDAVFLADEQSGRIVDANRRALALLGCQRS